jgi:signal transduction histidine kinase/CheY-like chemotaxis protein
MPYHKLLQRQLDKLSREELNSDERFNRLVELVNSSYKAFEKDKEITEHVFQISQKEFSEINSKLKEEVEIKRFSIRRLKAALNEINIDEIETILDNDDDLLEIVDLINSQMSKRKEVESQLILAKKEAENASNAKSEFLSVVSHEIRTPLNAIIGMGHLLMKANPRLDQVENLKVLKISSDNLLLLINDLLDYNKIEAGDLDFENAVFNLKKLLAEIVDLNRNKANERLNKLILNLDDNLPNLFLGDQARLGQIINNLVSNAIKFTKRGTVTLNLILKSRNEESAIVEVSVIDTGVGIAEENLNSIFLPFKQVATSIVREHGGTGLGLAISKRILKKLNSDIFVESEFGAGSKFYFELELKTVVEKDSYLHSDQINHYNLHKKRILLVEDTLYNIAYATQLLEGWNAEVITAENGAIAVETMLTNNYDLILMDLQMPIMDGYTATSKIREFNSVIPIIALTASASSNVREQVIKAGMQDYVNKPFNPDDFYIKLKKYLN